MLTLLGAVWLGAALMMAALWGFQRETGDAGIVDVGWAGGLGLAALFYAWAGPGDHERRILLAAMAGFWSFRLAAYILVRGLGRPEDGRYSRLRVLWGRWAQRNFFWFFQAQAALVAVLSVPFLIVAFDPRPGLDWRAWLGAALAILAVGGETLADRDLMEFRAVAGNAGRVCRRGLWRYSRHPNYFFEWLHWWAYVVLALGAPDWYWTLLGPGVMLVFLRYFTGIPYTEAQALRTRPGYAEYQRTTSAFFPWFPRKS